MTRVTRLPGDHSQVGWLPPSSVPYHYSEKDSSPLTRGKRRRFREWPGRTRLIPAHAGKTRQCPPWFPDRTAHPRSRGENEYVPTNGDVLEGSSPLTRGKHCSFLSGFGGSRLIPAHAGKTWGVVHESAALKAHPRSRGENRMPRTTRVIATGSSPLTRGKLVGDRLASTVYRLIPAHAGKTLFWRLVSPRHPAHPRSRGENAYRSAPLPACCGSSPLTRGKRRRRRWGLGVRRLIPAHAGKTG